MIKQSIKDVYYIDNRWLVLPNTWIQRLRFSGKSGLLLHLGCGDDYLDGMINIDGNFRRKKEMWLDLRAGLPFADESAELIYCSHTLEHLYPYEAIVVLSEIYRILSPEGVARISVRSFEKCLAIARGDEQSEWPRKFEDNISQAINYLFCDGQHKYGYAASTMKAFAVEAGFERIVEYSKESGCAPKEYAGKVVGGEPPGSLVYELRK